MDSSKQPSRPKRTVREFLQQVESDPAGRRILHFHVSRLPKPPETKQMRVATEFLRDTLDRLGEGDIAIAPNGDILVWFKGLKLANALSICRKIENWFCGEDEFTAKNYYGEIYFYTVLDAAMELGKVRTFVISMIDFGRAATGAPDAPKELISVENFSKIVDIVQRSDLSTYIFNQPIYNITHRKTSIEFIEFYVGMKNFEDTLCSEYSITGDAWLFNRLTEEFDKAVLRHMHREIADYRHKAFSLNLNLKSVFTKEFSVFVEDIPTLRSGRVILEINKLSMLSQWSLFEEVAQMARQKNLKICIDGMEVRDFANLHLSNLDFDFIKLKWSPTFFHEKEHLNRAVAEMACIDRSKVILSMCDSDEAFAFAKAAGIRFVQGRLADKYFRNSVAI